MIAAALRAQLGIAPRPVLLSQLASDPRRAVEGCRGIVTTDCHRAEVRAVSPRIPVFQVAFDPVFPRQLAEFAQRGRVVMVVYDRAFAAVFARLLRQLHIPPEVIRRFTFYEPGQARPALGKIADRATVYVSPLLPPDSIGPLPSNAQPVRGRWRIEAHSLEKLKASLALNLADRRGTAEAARPPA
ncbi:MAG: hypothetical protein GTN89_04720 [Acidobacteria bacterium]|nr:hypothetical protein [Acidobacteriota bacterium]NIQ29673.1 hypothetical protein [Acidobacteriota bacterium]